MTVSDTFGDCLTRIRNAQMARLPWVDVIYSKLIMSFCDIMQQEGYLASFERSSDGRAIRINLRYTNDGLPVIKHLKRVSKLGCRVYTQKKNIPMVYRGLGMQILSTSRGLMQSYCAKGQGIGGEVLCSVF